MPSMKEIARKAGVSVATVSRVFNSSPLVSEESRTKVLKCLDESGYHMNLQARSLRTNRANRIIALIPSMRNPIFAEIIGGMCDAAKSSGYSLILASIENDFGNASQYIEMLGDKQADGIIFISKSFRNEDIDAVRGHYPFVLCNEMLPDGNAPYISIDNYKAAVEATEYLVGCGCRKIGYISGQIESPSTHMRVSGFKDVLTRHDIPFSDDSMIFGTNSRLSEYPKIQNFIMKHDFDGFLVNSDIKAALAIKCLIEERGLAYSGIRLVSFDGSYASKLVVPAITSIIQPMAEIGKLAIENIIAQIEKRDFSSETIVPYKFEIRNT